MVGDLIDHEWNLSSITVPTLSCIHIEMISDLIDNIGVVEGTADVEDCTAE